MPVSVNVAEMSPAEKSCLNILYMRLDSLLGSWCAGMTGIVLSDPPPNITDRIINETTISYHAVGWNLEWNIKDDKVITIKLIPKKNGQGRKKSNQG